MLKCSQCENEKRWYTLTVQSPNGTPDGYGQVNLNSNSNWTTEGTIKVNFISKGGREFFRGAKIQADVTDILETPSTNFSRSILPSWRLLFGSRVFQIIAAFDVNEERHTVQIQTKEAL